MLLLFEQVVQQLLFSLLCNNFHSVFVFKFFSLPSWPCLFSLRINNILSFLPFRLPFTIRLISFNYIRIRAHVCSGAGIGKCTRFCQSESSLIGLGVFDKTPSPITSGKTQWVLGNMGGGVLKWVLTLSITLNEHYNYNQQTFPYWLLFFFFFYFWQLYFISINQWNDACLSFVSINQRRIQIMFFLIIKIKFLIENLYFTLYKNFYFPLSFLTTIIIDIAI